ncbi:uncharacterized protein LKV04_004864 [Tautogolabrus adspersus]
MLANADQAVLPPNSECCKLSQTGLGIPRNDLPGGVSNRGFVQLSWTLSEFNNYICQSFPMVSLNVIGFHLARADKTRVLTKIQANMLKDLKKTVGRSRVYIIPHTTITLLLQIPEPEMANSPPETSPPAGPETASWTLASSATTQLMATSTAASTAIRPAASTTAPAAIDVCSSQSPASLALRPPASPSAPQVTPPVPMVPMNVPAFTSNSSSHVSAESPPLNGMSLSSTLDIDGSSPRTDLNPSLEASLDPAQWLNAGTPEVFYRRTRVEPPNSTSVNDFVIDDSEEEDDIIAVPFESDMPTSEEVDLAIILSTFREDHLSGGVISTICIRRKKLLESAIKAISRVTFCWTDSPQIEFVGEDADDMGGPQREFFRLLMIEVQTSLGIFEGKAGQVFLSYDQAALDQNEYLRGGNLIAWSIAHGGPCIKALDPSLFQLMCGQEPPLEQFDWLLLPDPDVQSKVEKILQCKTAGDLTALQQDLGDWINECGVPFIFTATVEDIPKIYAYVVKHYIFLRITTHPPAPLLIHLPQPALWIPSHSFSHAHTPPLLWSAIFPFTLPISGIFNPSSSPFAAINLITNQPLCFCVLHLGPKFTGYNS